MNFGEALQALKEGRKVKIKTWHNGYLYLVQGSKFVVNRPPLNELLPEGTEVTYEPHIDYMDKGAFSGGVRATVWIPSMREILSESWEVVE